MTIQVFYGADEIPVKWIEFSDGAKNVKLGLPEQHYNPDKAINVTVLPITPVKDVLWDLVLVVSAIKKWDRNIYPTVNLPYLPNARADRVFEEGNAAPLEEFLSIVAQLSIRYVRLTDPHSNVYQTILSNVSVKTQADCFMETVAPHLDKKHQLWIVAPDDGAKDKSISVLSRLNAAGFTVGLIQCSKKRDISTGRITEINVPEVDLRGQHVIIVDDICDGGGTFIPIAEKLSQNGAGVLDLYVTHGIFAKGLDLFKTKIDNIYCYQTVGSYVNRHDIMTFNSN
jgi:ribose-phosphate pyrophosphokinase